MSLKYEKEDKITPPQKQANMKAEQEAPSEETKLITKHLLQKSNPQKKILELLKNQLSQLSVPVNPNNIELTKEQLRQLYQMPKSKKQLQLTKEQIKQLKNENDVIDLEKEQINQLPDIDLTQDQLEKLPYYKRLAENKPLTKQQRQKLQSKVALLELNNKLKLNNYFTQAFPAEKEFDKVKDNVPQVPYYNYMADLLMLPEDPTTNNKYLLVVVDLATNNFDVRGLKNKDANSVLIAFKNMIAKSKYIKKPQASVKTDQGSEFKGVFHKYLFDNDIFHRVALAGRHKSLGNVERLNRELGRYIMAYQNEKEEETGKVYKEWESALPDIVKKLNEARQIHLTKDDLYDIEEHKVPLINPNSKFNIGDWVSFKLPEPRNALGEKLKGSFREGDYKASKKSYQIKKIFDYPMGHRYLLDGVPGASFTDKELKLEKNNKNRFEVKKEGQIDEDLDEMPQLEQVINNNKKEEDEPIQEKLKEALKNVILREKTNKIKPEDIKEAIEEVKQEIKPKKEKSKQVLAPIIEGKRSARANKGINTKNKDFINL
jgi:hypothetical protein